MTYVATLISNPAVPALDAAALERARAVPLPGASRPNWLDAGIAADIPFTPAGRNDQRSLADRVRDALAGRPIDVVVQAEAIAASGCSWPTWTPP